MDAKLTYIQIFIPIFKYLSLGTNHLYLSSGGRQGMASPSLHKYTDDMVDLIL